MNGAWIAVKTEADIISVRQSGRALAEAMGFTATEIILIATALSEIARNMVEYGRGGEVHFGRAQRDGRLGLEITARDRGPGIADLELAMQDGFSTGRGLGLGLPGARRLMDEFDVESAVGTGTTVVMRKWLMR